MPTFSLQCGPNADPNIRKVRNADPMPPLRTFLVTLPLSLTQNVPYSLYLYFVRTIPYPIQVFRIPYP